MSEYYKIKAETLTSLADQGRRLTGYSNALSPSELIALLKALDVPLGAVVNLDMSNRGANTVCNTLYNATIGNNGSFLDGQFVVSNSGYLTINSSFMSEAYGWTVAFTIDSHTLNSSAKHCRVARGGNDVPSIYSWQDYDGFFFKLASGRATTSLVNWYDAEVLTVQSNGSLSFSLPTNSKTVLAFRNDEQYISLWINGVMVAKQETSAYTSSYRAPTFSIGDNASSGYDMISMTCSMLRGWPRSLSDWEMKLLAPV